MTHRIPRVVSAGIVVGLAASLTTAIPATAAADRATLAARWQGGELRNGRIPSAFVEGADWGLTVDTLFALAADGSQPRRVRAVGKAVRNNIEKYTTFGDSVFAGARAKIVLAADVLGRDPRHFGGMNTRAQLLRMAVDKGSGFESGRLKDRGGDDFSNTFTQTYGVLALARTGVVPQHIVGYLLKQRCGAGYFRITETRGRSCRQAGSAPDVDSTALGLQAMLVARRQGGATVSMAKVRRTATWLARHQRPNGAFGGGSSTKGLNANSTGLAAQALKAARRTDAAQDASGWLRTLQITRAKADGGKARDEIGAVAYNRSAFREVLRDGVTKATRDQFRRATAQAVLGLARVPFGAIHVGR